MFEYGGSLFGKTYGDSLFGKTYKITNPFSSFCRVPKEKVLCAVEGCDNMKRYSCSKTNLPLCSLECYKKVQQTRPLGVA